jgi:hypothetical protein
MRKQKVKPVARRRNNQTETASRKPEERTSSATSSLSDAERKLRIRSMLPVTLDYSPFESPANMKRLLADLAVWILAGRIHHRQASACRALVQAWIGVDEHERLDKIEERVRMLEGANQH